MSELSKKDSDSDVDSNSSWTLLTEEVGEDDDRSSKKQDQNIAENVTSSDPEQQDKNSEIKENESAPEKPEIIPQENEINDDLETISSSSYSAEFLLEENEPENNSKQGCVTFEEYLTEKEVSDDNDYDTAEYWERLCSNDKRRKRKYKKSKADNLTTMTVVGAVLSLAGLSLICMLTPQFGKHVISPNIQSKIEKNFTKIETPFATDTDLKVYIDTSNKAIKLIDKVEVLEPYIAKCCNSHAKNVDAPQKTSAKNEKPNPKTEGNEKPVTLEQFLKENLSKKFNRKQKPKVNTKGITNIQDITNEKVGRDNVELKSQTKTTVTKKNGNLKQEEAYKKDSINKEISKDEGSNKKTNNSRQEKELHIKQAIDKNNRYLKNKNKRMERFINKKNHENRAKIEELPGKMVVVERPEKIKNFKSMLQPTIRGNEPNFVLLSSRTAKSNFNDGHFKIEPMEKIIAIPNKKEQQSIDNKKIQGDADTISKNEVPEISTEETSESHNYHTDFITCQLLQDICMLKLTGRLKAETKTKEKKLKRKLERKKHRPAKTYAESSEPEDNSVQNKNFCKTVVNNPKRIEIEKFLKEKVKLNFKPKLVNNHFVIECKQLQVSNVPPLSNIDLLKELPFHIKRKREVIIAKTLEKVANERVIIGRIERIAANNMQSSVSAAKRIQKEIMNNKLAALLENARKNNEEKLRLLEQMRQDNRLKIQKIIKERRDRMKKDASLGIYNIPLPKYTEVSEKLKQLKQKPQKGFVIESGSSSESDTERCFPKAIENKISYELMTALRMGKKVSDSFRDWTLKKAPSLICLKNYCNSKVSQISEKLTNQSFNQTNITSSLSRQELKALMCRKEKHEQLKKFWRSKQEYLDKRIEICKLLKKKLSSNNIIEDDVAKQNFAQGVQLLDSIISDVLKSVRNSKSCVNNTCPVETDVRASSKSVGNVAVANEGQVEHLAKRTNETVSSTSGDLYNWLFEKKALEIRRRDSIMWSLSKPGHVEKKKEVSKQDPSKSYQDKIIKKHN